MVTPVEYLPPTITLTHEQQTLCTNTLRFLQDTIPLLDNVAAVDIDVTAYRALREKLVQVATEIKARFCDNKPLIGM